VELAAGPKVLVRAPWWADDREVARVLEKSASWIQKRLDGVKENAATLGPESGTILYLGKPRPLRVVAERILPAATPDLGRVTIQVPADWDGPRRVARLRREVERWYRDRAGELLPARVAAYAPMVGVPVPQVRISSARKRWGSCNPACRRLNLAWRLVMAPLDLVDYVVVHELCHLKEPNHGPEFWRLVAKALPDWQARRSRLRRLAVDLAW